jgi:hypothetical protein
MQPGDAGRTTHRQPHRLASIRVWLCSRPVWGDGETALHIVAQQH